jgi:hypothetical protein
MNRDTKKRNIIIKHVDENNLNQKIYTNSCPISHHFRPIILIILVCFCGGAFIRSQNGAHTAFAYGSYYFIIHMQLS